MIARVSYNTEIQHSVVMFSLFYMHFSTLQYNKVSRSCTEKHLVFLRLTNFLAVKKSSYVNIALFNIVYSREVGKVPESKKFARHTPLHASAMTS